jgi:NhaA family Na+:H+ antiporter
MAPVERFVSIEASSGIVLLLSAMLAMAVANSPLRDVYERVWTFQTGFSVGEWSFVRDLRWWVNDALMSLFFFVVGIEIRREIRHGELSEVRRAALPLAAALGGMVLPALIYIGFNAGRATSVGWGVPMATDIAFAVGVFALLGKRVAPALRILLLALAVIDDVGAIMVIALFYSTGVSAVALGMAALGLGAMVVFQGFGLRSRFFYVPAALVAWGGVYSAGIHPTIAGVLVGLLVPATAWVDPERFAQTAEEGAAQVRAALAQGNKHVESALAAVELAAREAVAPAERLQHALHGWVAYAVMPLFAFANAGVALGSASFEGDGMRVFLGIFLGLLVGKALGVFAFSRLAAAVGIASAPRGVKWRDISVVGVVAGIGFTMALFVAQLAFPAGPMLETAKLAILAASLLAGVVGLVAGRLLLRERREEGEAETLAEAERSTVA